jgi:hypothetical protein
MHLRENAAILTRGARYRVQPRFSGACSFRDFSPADWGELII